MTSSCAPDVSLVVPAYNRADLLAACLGSIERSTGATHETVVVDNASPEDLSAVRERFPGMRWLRQAQNVGYAAANNLGLADARGRCVCFLNSDAELLPQTLAQCVAYLHAHPDVGAVTPCNVGPDQIPQATLSPEHTLVMAWLRDSGFHLLFPTLPPFRGWMLPGFRFDHTQEVATSQTTCLVVRAEVHRALAGMDASLFLFYNDVDYCRRLRGAGWRLVYLAETRVIHHGSASVETAPWKERQLWRDRYRFFRRWYGSAGTAGVRFACLHRMLTRVLAQLPKGRPAQMRRLWQEGLALYRTLAEERNGA